MDNSIEPSIAIRDLATLINPSNFLRWRKNWRQRNPIGERFVGYTDPHEYIEHLVDEDGDFLLEVRCSVKSVKEELEELKSLQLDGMKDTIDSEKFYGAQLRNMLEKIHRSKVMPKIEGPIEKIFQLLEESVREDLQLDIAFSRVLEKSIVDEASQTEKSNKPDEGLGGMLESNKKNTVSIVTEAIKVQDSRNFVYKKDHTEVVQRRLAFLKRSINPYSSLSDSEHADLIEIVNQMFIKREQVDGDRTFPKTISTEISETEVLTAFGNIIHELLKRKRPKWYIPSIKVLFHLNGSVKNIGKKLKDGVDTLPKD